MSLSGHQHHNQHFQPQLTRPDLLRNKYGNGITTAPNSTTSSLIVSLPTHDVIFHLSQTIYNPLGVLIRLIDSLESVSIHVFTSGRVPAERLSYIVKQGDRHKDNIYAIEGEHHTMTLHQSARAWEKGGVTSSIYQGSDCYITTVSDCDVRRYKYILIGSRLAPRARLKQFNDIRRRRKKE